jgi:hypothetical protein
MRPLIALFVAILALSGAATNSFSAEADNNSNRIIQYRGPMPALGKDTWGSEVELRFELYRSPNGGTPFWSEARRVPVSAQGLVSVDLGQVTLLPDEAFKTPFRFLSIWHNQVELLPRKQVVSVAYVASAYEAGVTKESYAEFALAAAKAAADKAPNRQNRLDALIDCGSFAMEAHPRHRLTWLEAAGMAARLGGHLPTFEEWYAAYDGEAAKRVVGMAGHYEWVVPWVYEPAIHARMQELYRGKPVACYYNEISPLNLYPFRLVERRKAPKKSE